MKLTKDQRFTAYCIMRKEANRMKGTGFCFLIDSIFNIHSERSSRYNRYAEMRETFPELFDKREYPMWHTWLFNNWGSRVAALEQCILETHP